MSPPLSRPSLRGLPPGRGSSAQEQVERALDRVRELEVTGQKVSCVQTLASNAAEQARRIDSSPGATGLLAGMAAVVKDNINTRDLCTTAGSKVLEFSRPGKDAFVVEQMRDAGLVLLGKAAMTRLSNLLPGTPAGRSSFGQVRNAHDPDCTADGSSSGSAVAVAADIVPAALGTETDGSITFPAAANGVVGFKPTLGLVSRSGVVPIASSFDTPGPIAKDVSTAAALLQVIAGMDPNDPATHVGAKRPADLMGALSPNALRGVRLGVVGAPYVGYDAGTDAAFERSLRLLEKAGATLVDVKLDVAGELDPTHVNTMVLNEFKEGIEAYLRALDNPALPQTLEEFIALSRSMPEEELTPDGLRWFEASAVRVDRSNPEYQHARRLFREVVAAFGPVSVMRRHRLQALVAPTRAPAESLLGPKPDYARHATFCTPAAHEGLPHLTVPMGASRGMPVGLSFVGEPWADAKVLGYGFAFEELRRRAEGA